MKFNINLNQPAMIEFKLKTTEFIVLDVLSVSNLWAEPVVLDGEVYYWTARQKIAEELTAFGYKDDTIYRTLKTLKEKGFIDYEKLGKKDITRLSKKGKKVFGFIREVQEKGYVGKKSELLCRKKIRVTMSEKNPTYNNTSITIQDNNTPPNPQGNREKVLSENNSNQQERVKNINFRKFIARLKEQVPNQYKLKIKDISFDKSNSSLDEIENNNLAYKAFLEISKTQTIENIIKTYFDHIEAEKNNQGGRFVKGLVKFLLAYNQIQKSIEDSNTDNRPIAVEYINGLIEDYQTGADISWMDIKLVEKKYHVVGKSMLDAELNRRAS